MDLSSKEFTLNFRGFEQDDPDTVKRFTAFCEANFALSPDTFGDTPLCADGVVLTHGESPEALEALAKVLREIGARVDVSEDCRIEEHAALEGPSTQELHRLFGHQQENGAANQDGPSCPYPPLGRTLYLLNGSDHVLDRRRVRPKCHHPEGNQETRVDHPRRRATLVAISVISLAIGSLALIAAMLLIKRSPGLLDERGHRPSFQSREHAEKTRSDNPVKDGQSTKSLNANARINGFNLELKVLASGRSLSISALTMIPDAESRMSDGSMIKRIVGDPAFLAESYPGDWTGPLRLSVFIDTDGRESHLTIPARVSVKVNDDNSAGRAFIEITNDSIKEAANEPSTRRSQAITRLADSPLSNLALF